MSIQEQFDAAVKVIQNLPKNGPYQPSTDMMLLFYSYYKQATKGVCTLPKPSFWDVVNKAKWNAWTSLGQMPKEEAMKLYIDEIKKIIEKMSVSPDVEQFLDVLAPFYENVKKDEKKGFDMNSNGMTALLGVFSENVNNEKFQALASKSVELTNKMDLAESPNVRDGEEKDFEEELEKLEEKFGKVDEKSSDQFMSQKKSVPEFFDDPDDSSDELFEDPLEDLALTRPLISKKAADLHRVQQLQVQMESTVDHLQRDMEQVLARIAFIENLIVKTKNVNATNSKSLCWLPFSELSGMTTFLLVIWPFVVHAIISSIKSTKS